jgi:hypothetical protein
VDFDVAADELFGLAPAAFVDRRNSLAALARSEGDAKLAAQIKALRRPTVGAALVNALARERREDIARFLALGAELRDAQARGDGQQMRVLLGRRQQLMRDLDREVAELANDRMLTATRAVLQEVHATLFAALSEPEAGALVRGGRLESALTDGGFADSASATTAGPNESAQRNLNEANARAAAADDAVKRLAAALSGGQLELADLDRQLDETRKRALRLERDKAAADRKVTAAQGAHADAVRRAKALREAAAKARTT